MTLKTGIIYNEDCMDTMRDMKTGSINLIVTSPPYNLRNSAGHGFNKEGVWGKSVIKDGYEKHDDNMPHGQYVEWQRECISEMMRVLSDDGAIFYNHKWRVQAGLLQDRADIVKGFPVRQIIIWHRAGGYNWNDSFYLPTYEVIYLITKPAFRLVDGANKFTDVWDIPQEIGTKHPAPFPFEVARRCIISTNAKIIYDPFMGSGTVAVAAKALGREWLGSEISKSYCEMTRERVSQQILAPGGFMDGADS